MKTIEELFEEQYPESNYSEDEYFELYEIFVKDFFTIKLGEI